jgi:hypothetical protein
MQTFSPTRPCPSSGRDALRAVAGRRAKARLDLASIISFSVLVGFVGLIAGALVACNDDDTPAPQAPATASASVLDASVRDLPGDGLDPTPESDVDNRQREPIGPDGLSARVDMIRDDLGISGPSGSASDASTPSASPDGAADAGTD